MPPRRSNEDISTLGHLNLIENSRECARWGVTGAVEESDGIMLFASGSSLPVICNGAFRTDDTADPVELVTRADAFFGGRGRGYTVMVRDQPADDDLRRACSAQGLLAFGDPSPEMSCTKRVEAVPSTDVDLRWVVDDGAVEQFAEVGAEFEPLFQRRQERRLPSGELGLEPRQQPERRRDLAQVRGCGPGSRDAGGQTLDVGCTVE